jgi:hypothetical protein
LSADKQLPLVSRNYAALYKCRFCAKPFEVPVTQLEAPVGADQALAMAMQSAGFHPHACSDDSQRGVGELCSVRMTQSELF